MLKCSVNNLGEGSCRRQREVSFFVVFNVTKSNVDKLSKVPINPHTNSSGFVLTKEGGSYSHSSTTTVHNSTSLQNLGFKSNFHRSASSTGDNVIDVESCFNRRQNRVLLPSEEWTYCWMVTEIEKLNSTENWYLSRTLKESCKVERVHTISPNLRQNG